MVISSDSVVREIALTVPGALRVFDRYQVDYCCGGGKSLFQACEVAHVNLDEIVQKLAEEGLREGALAVEPTAGTLGIAGLIAHILDTHHVYEREAMAHIEPLMAKVLHRHGTHHPELAELSRLFHALVADLGPHFLKEEQVLFPFAEGLAQAQAVGQTPRQPPFGTYEAPIRMMRQEHDIVGDFLHSMRAVTSKYSAPEGACTSYRGLYKALSELDTDIIHHVHLENNVLFPMILTAAGQSLR